MKSCPAFAFRALNKTIRIAKLYLHKPGKSFSDLFTLRPLFHEFLNQLVYAYAVGFSFEITDDAMS